MEQMLKKLSAGVFALALLAGCGSSPKQSPGNTPPENTQQPTAVNRPADHSYLTPSVPAAAPARKTSRGAPDFVRAAMQGVAHDELVSVGMAVSVKGVSTDSRAQRTAESRARASISRQLITFVKDRLVDYAFTARMSLMRLIHTRKPSLKFCQNQICS
jgi:uncharacterized lipoprotein YajG